jgi:alpha-L-fucosidase
VVSDLKFLQNGQEDGSYWVPAEVDVSIRPGWFYHTSEDDKVKPLEKLVDIYYNSVGRNASLLLNFPVDTSGQINPIDAERVKQLSEVIKADFAKNLVLGKKATATNFRGKSAKYKAALAIDGNTETAWATDNGVVSTSLTIDFGKPTTFNRFLVQEYIRLGQRVQKFSIEAEASEGWKEIASGTTIGYKRILRFPGVTASKLRLNILAAKGSPMISEVGVYNAPTNFYAPSAPSARNN